MDILTTKLAGANTHNSTLQKELDKSYRHKQEKTLLESKIDKLQETVRVLALQNQDGTVSYCS